MTIREETDSLQWYHTIHTNTDYTQTANSIRT